MTRTASSHSRHCPKCRQPLRHVHRTEAERLASPATARYACTSEGCGWSGLLQQGAPRRKPSPVATLGAWTAAARGGVERLRSAIERSPVVLLAVGAGVVLTVLAGRHVAGETQPPRADGMILLAPGEHHDGDTPAADDPLLIQPDVRSHQTAVVGMLTVRNGCVWGQPGRNPYRGTVEEALVTARLPPEVVQRIALKAMQGQPDDRLEISNAGIRGIRHGRQFDAGNVAMTYGRTLCVNTQVNFKDGRVEPGSLYQATDSKGRDYAVMVPDVCGNVSVLGPWGERTRPVVGGVVGERERTNTPGRPTVLGVIGERPKPDLTPVPVLDQRRPRSFTASRLPNGPDALVTRTAINSVPEPSTLACVAAALAVMVLIRGRKTRT